MGYRGNKFNAKKVVIDGIKFDSIKEGEYYLYTLKPLLAAGEIQQLEVKPPKIEFVHNGVFITSYRPDFRFFENGVRVTVDVKSGPTKTRDYRIRKKLMKAFYNIEVREV